MKMIIEQMNAVNGYFADDSYKQLIHIVILHQIVPTSRKLNGY